MRTSVTDRNNALQLAGDRLNGGLVRFYSGTPPVGPDSGLSGNVLIAQCALGNPACQPPQSGTMVFNPIASSAVSAAGDPTFARFFRSDGVTAVTDMDVPGEISLSKASWILGEPFAAPSITWSMAAE